MPKHSPTTINLLKGDHVTQKAGVWMAERIMLKWPVSIDPTLKTYRQPASAGDLPSLHWGSVRLRACRLSLCLASSIPSRESRALGRHTAIWTTSMTCRQGLSRQMNRKRNNEPDKGFVITCTVWDFPTPAATKREVLLLLIEFQLGFQVEELGTESQYFCRTSLWLFHCWHG